MAISLNEKYLKKFMSDSEVDKIWPQVEAAHKTIYEKSGYGNDFLGWVDLPFNYDKEEYERVKAAAKRIRSNSKAVVVIGIGGSYLGARAAIEYIKSPFHNELDKESPDIYFAGNSISPAYLNGIIKLCDGKDLTVITVSKSGTTVEPGIAFRAFRKILNEKYGEAEAKKRIYCVTDKCRGALKKFADEQGFETFVIPDDVGGRYSMFTPGGLLPIAVAGIDIDELMRGAKDAAERYSKCDKDNVCYRYAALRNILYRKGRSVEMLVGYEPALLQTAEWFKQLYGESEGKDQKGIFPASAIFSTDLHSLGQYIQDGSKIIFETVLNVENGGDDYYIEKVCGDFDGLNYLADRGMSEVNRKAYEGTVLAHTAGNTPNIIINVPGMSAYDYGCLIYFFEKAAGISGYMLGVNPFDQPGVESYKKNMFALLGKKGFEDMREKLEKELGE